MVSIKFLFVATAGALTAAMPGPTPAAAFGERAVDCAKVNGALSVLKRLGPPATSFCSSYLRIPATKTTTLFITPTAVTRFTATTTVTNANVPCDQQQKRNVPLDYRGFNYARPADLEHRTDQFAALAVFAAAKVSDGCNCLGLKPKATTTIVKSLSVQTIDALATVSTCVKQK
ncbi:hypothetical protein ACN47E_008012 [Coniothyrium glycines]